MRAARDANLISANPICLQRTMRRPEAETIPTDSPTRIPNEKFLGLVLNVKISHNAIALYHAECHVLQSEKKMGPSLLLRGPHTLATWLVKVWRLYFTPTG